jgi:aminoglycoside 3-N-acetyltransferase
MLRSTLASLLSERQKRLVKRRLNAAKTRFASLFRRFDGEDLKFALWQMGVAETDTLMVHANFRHDSGFQGSPADLVSAFVELVGKHGNFMMVSIPFRGYAYDYLAQGKPFHVKRTVSMMGLVSEVFRRQPGVIRSRHPTHPVLAYGKDAASIAAGHENAVFPTGEGTPFERLCQLDGRVLLFDVGFGALTLFHHVEHLLRHKLSLPLYDERLFAMKLIDEQDREHTVQTYAFAKGVIRHQRKLEMELRRRGVLRTRKLGNSTLMLVNARDVVDTMSEMIDSGVALLERAVH